MWYVCQRGGGVDRRVAQRASRRPLPSIIYLSLDTRHSSKVQKKGRKKRCCCQERHPTGHGSMVARRNRRKTCGRTPIDGRVWRPSAASFLLSRGFLLFQVLRLVSFQVETLAAFCPSLAARRSDVASPGGSQSARVLRAGAAAACAGDVCARAGGGGGDGWWMGCGWMLAAEAGALSLAVLRRAKMLGGGEVLDRGWRMDRGAFG